MALQTQRQATPTQRCIHFTRCSPRHRRPSPQPLYLDLDLDPARPETRRREGRPTPPARRPADTMATPTGWQHSSTPPPRCWRTQTWGRLRPALYPCPPVHARGSTMVSWTRRAPLRPSRPRARAELPSWTLGRSVWVWGALPRVSSIASAFVPLLLPVFLSSAAAGWQEERSPRQAGLRERRPPHKRKKHSRNSSRRWRGRDPPSRFPVPRLPRPTRPRRSCWTPRLPAVPGRKWSCPAPTLRRCRRGGLSRTWSGQGLRG